MKFINDIKNQVDNVKKITLILGAFVAGLMAFISHFDSLNNSENAKND
jgi:hypothetical protein